MDNIYYFLVLGLLVKWGIKMKKDIKVLFMVIAISCTLVFYGCEDVSKSIDSIPSASSSLSTSSIMSDIASKSNLDEETVKRLTKALDDAGMKNEIGIDRKNSRLYAVIYPLDAEACEIFKGYEDWDSTKKAAVRTLIKWDEVTAGTKEYGDSLFEVAKSMGLEGSFLVVSSEDKEYVLMTFADNNLIQDILA